MKNFVLASSNEHKKEEYNKILEKLNINFLSLKDKNIYVEAIEDGKTFEENAYKKARFYKNLVSEAVIADDSGLVIDELPDILGIYSSRFMEGSPYIKKCNEVLKRLEGKANRNARFVCCICLILENDETYIFKGVVEGTIGFKYEGTHGFGYDPIFIPNGFDNTLGIISEDIKNKISHRAQAAKKLKQFLMEGVKTYEDITY